MAEITLKAPLAKVLKAPERSQLVNAFTQAFKTSGISNVSVKDIFFVDRRSGAVPSEGTTFLVVTFSLDGVSVQIIDALDALIEEGSLAGRKLLVSAGGNSLVDPDGNLLSDERLVELIATARLVKSDRSRGRTGLVYGNVLYFPWSAEPISIVLTVMSADILNEIVDGRMRGLAPYVKVKWFTCSICGEMFDECDHKIGEEYNGRVCLGVPRDIQFLEETVTDLPVDPRCRMTDLLILGKERIEQEWYGFQGVNILDRLGNINEAKKDEIISKEAASKFKLYFSRHSVGHCKFHETKAKEKAKSLATSRRK